MRMMMMIITNAVWSVHISKRIAAHMKQTLLICLRSLMVNLMQTTFLVHLFLNWHPKPYHSFGHAGPLFSGEKQHQIHPLESQCIRRVGTLLFHAVTIKHAPSTCNNSALSRSHSIPPETLNKGQLQTCCKLWPRAFGSCQKTQVVLNTFKAEGVLKYCYLSRRQRQGMLAQEC